MMNTEEIDAAMQNRFHIKTKVTYGGKHYLVSTVELIGGFHGLEYETMAFACDAEGEVTNWFEMYCDKYDSEEEARKGHDFALKTFRPE